MGGRVVGWGVSGVGWGGVVGGGGWGGGVGEEGRCVEGTLAS